MFKILALFLLVQLGLINCTSEPASISLLMPNVSPKQRDLYLCHKFPLDLDRPIYITEFYPQAKKDTAHHMLLFSCEDTVPETTWNCGEMSTTSAENTFASGPVCQSSQQIVYAWAMDAPELILPKDVAFKLGGQSKKNFLVLQVHYANVDKFKDGSTDSSGLILKGQYEPVKNLASVYLTGTAGYIRKDTEEYFDAACQIREDVVMHPFAYRTHAHKLGLVNSGYVIKRDPETGKREWIEIGRRSPQLPQMFYPVSNNVTIERGDIVATRCTMENTRDHTVYIGPTGEDEMCNFYIMYYVDGSKVAKNNICYTSGPPFWHFTDFRAGNGEKIKSEDIPKDISEVPETTEETMDHNSHMSMDHGSHAKMMNEMMYTSSDSSTESNEDNYKDDVDDVYESTLKEIEKEALRKNLLRKFLKESRK